MNESQLQLCHIQSPMFKELKIEDLDLGASTIDQATLIEGIKLLKYN
jgi:hypothetical protein